MEAGIIQVVEGQVTEGGIIQVIWVAAGTLVTGAALLGLAWKHFLGPAITRETAKGCKPLDKKLDDLLATADTIRGTVRQIHDPQGAIRSRLRRIEHGLTDDGG